jgi:hypothetical protein
MMVRLSGESGVETRVKADRVGKYKNRTMGGQQQKLLGQALAG